MLLNNINFASFNYTTALAAIGSCCYLFFFFFILCVFILKTFVSRYWDYNFSDGSLDLRFPFVWPWFIRLDKIILYQKSFCFIRLNRVVWWRERTFFSFVIVRLGRRLVRRLIKQFRITRDSHWIDIRYSIGKLVIRRQKYHGKKLFGCLSRFIVHRMEDINKKFRDARKCSRQLLNRLFFFSLFNYNVIATLMKLRKKYISRLSKYTS